MQPKIVIDKGRTNVVLLSLGMDVSGDVIQSQIRDGIGPEADVLATWVIEFSTDGTDGEIILTLDDSETAEIAQTNAYMDIRRISGGEPLSLHDGWIEVFFRETVTQDDE